jgi:hypothetical protein
MHRPLGAAVCRPRPHPPFGGCFAGHASRRFAGMNPLHLTAGFLSLASFALLARPPPSEGLGAAALIPAVADVTTRLILIPLPLSYRMLSAAALGNTAVRLHVDRRH